MKTIIAAALALAFSTASMAQIVGQGQTSNTASQSTAANQGNNQALTVNQAANPANTTATLNTIASGTQDLRTVPTVVAPNLTSSGFACLGSKSGSASVLGFGGSAGSTTEDDQCNAREWAKLYVAWGLRDAALARICEVPSEKTALELTGFVCPQTKAAEKRASADMARQLVEVHPELTDPIARARVGYPPITFSGGYASR